VDWQGSCLVNRYVVLIAGGAGKMENKPTQKQAQATKSTAKTPREEKL
jgi:hypothetical protein